MKLKVHSVNRLLTTTVLLTVFTVLISTAPAAMAMPGMSQGDSPDPVVEGAIITLELGSDASPGVAPHTLVRLHVYEVGLDPVFPSTVAIAAAPNGCVLPNGGGANVAGNPTTWQLQRDDSSVAEFTVNHPGQLEVTFGNGAPAETVTLTNAVDVMGAYAGDYNWIAIGGFVQPDDTSKAAPFAVDEYRWAGCGDESISVSPAGHVEFFEETFFNTKQPVGGTIIPIDATSLVLASVISNPILTMAMLSVIAVIGFGTLYAINRR